MNWISVKERLPEGDECVIVYRDPPTDACIPFHVSNPEFVRQHWEDWDIKFWMPLPDLPRFDDPNRDLTDDEAAAIAEADDAEEPQFGEVKHPDPEKPQ